SRAIDRLPDPEALRELVDLTGVKWILLRPADEWPRNRMRDDLVELISGVGAVRLEVDGYLLQRIDLVPQHPGWGQALERGYRPGESLLGTSYAILAPTAFDGAIAAPPRARAFSGEIVEIPIEIANRGTAGWPGALSGNGGAPGEIFVAARWWPSEVRPSSPRREVTPPVAGIDTGLRRDLPSGEAMRQVLSLPVPKSGDG